jgi:nucleoid-associated protein YgaU
MLIFVLYLDQAPPARMTQQPAATAATAAAPPPLAPAPIQPAFDIVRISPQGDAVIAGRAAPGSDVTVQAGGKDIGHTTADAGGSWVLVPTDRLPPGAQALTLWEKRADGTQVAGAGSLLTVVPAPSAPPGAPALAVLDQPGAAPRVLQAPPGGAAGKLGLAAVDYDDRGQVRFAGTAPPGAAVRVYVDDHAAGDAVADAQGRWTLSPAAAIAPGQHRLRVDQLDTRGRVAARVALPFQREQLAAAQLHGDQVVVQPGESLWRLAQRNYGNGLHYTVIYQANTAQIRDPDKIYPGQTLTLPQAQ